MSKRKPALRIGGGVLNRNTLVSGPDNESPRDLQANGSVPSKTQIGGNDIDTEVANFLKEIDEVAATDDTSPGNAEKTNQVKYGDWQQCVDEKTQHPYYWNTVTDEVTWVLPNDVLQHVSEADQSEEQLAGTKKSNNEINATISNDRSLPMSDELDIDAELERAVEEKASCIQREIATPQSEIHHKSESPNPEKKEQPNVNESVGDKEEGAKHESELGDENAVAEVQDEITELSQTLFSKLQFLGISSAALTNFHFLLIQIQTRISDWRENALSTSFVLKKLQEADQQLKAYEKSATPSGWSCHWDSSAERYYYMNDKTEKKQWQYPEVTIDSTDGSASETAGTEDGATPVKKSRKDGAGEASLPPLPATPQERPPLPPQPQNEVEGEGDSDNPDADDGIMMEISDGETEIENTKKSEKLAAAAIMSQEAVLYKGPVANYRESSPGFDPKTLLSTATITAAVPDEKMMSTKMRRKKSKKTSSAVKKPSKGITSLVEQWKKAKHEIALEDRMLEEDDDEEETNQEELTQQQIEKWKKQQITSGKAYSNANFEPVPTDWRSRLLQKKKKV